MGACMNCSKVYKAQPDMLFCPYCGYGNISEHLNNDSLSLKIESIWGNQGVYAEKTVHLAEILKDKLHTCNSDDEEAESKNILDTSIEEIETLFFDLFNTQSSDQFKENYRELMENLKLSLSNNCNDKNQDLENDKLAIVRKKLEKFEHTLNLPVKTDLNTGFSKLEASKDVQNLENNLNSPLEKVIYELYETLEIFYENVLGIIKEQGLFCVINSNFNSNFFATLPEINSKKDERSTSEDAIYVFEKLRDRMNASSHLEYDQDILLFLESTWFFIEVTIEYSKLNYKSEVDEQIATEINNWFYEIEICINEAKYSKEINMIEVFRRGRKCLNQMGFNYR